jgi:hypothetical protein
MQTTRRRFFLAGGSILAAQGAPSDQVRLGVIGSGGSARSEFPLMHPDLEDADRSDAARISGVSGHAAR